MNKKTIIIFFIVIWLGVPAANAQELIAQPLDSTAQIRSMTIEQFKQSTTRNDKLVLVNFSADWCIVCKKQKPVLDELRSYYKDSLLLLEIDMENNPLIAEYYQVDALPVNLLFKNGELVWDRVGLKSKIDLMNAIWLYRIKTKKN